MWRSEHHFAPGAPTITDANGERISAVGTTKAAEASALHRSRRSSWLRVRHGHGGTNQSSIAGCCYNNSNSNSSKKLVCVSRSSNDFEKYEKKMKRRRHCRGRRIDEWTSIIIVVVLDSSSSNSNGNNGGGVGETCCYPWRCTKWRREHSIVWWSSIKWTKGLILNYIDSADFRL